MIGALVSEASLPIYILTALICSLASLLWYQNVMINPLDKGIDLLKENAEDIFSYSIRLDTQQSSGPVKALFQVLNKRLEGTETVSQDIHLQSSRLLPISLN